MDTNGLEGLGAMFPGGLRKGGLWEGMLVGALGARFAIFMGTLLVGSDAGFGLDEEPE